MATIAEVAREAGVGTATVSRVVDRSSAVREGTRRRVQDAIRRLGYAPNAAARALSTGRTGRVGVLAPFFTRPSVSARLRGVAHGFSSSARRRAGYEGGLRAAGLEPDPDLVVRTEHGRAGARRAARRLLALDAPAAGGQRRAGGRAAALRDGRGPGTVAPSGTCTGGARLEREAGY